MRKKIAFTVLALTLGFTLVATACSDNDGSASDTTLKKTRPPR